MAYPSTITLGQPNHQHSALHYPAGGRFVLGCTEDFPMSEFEKTFGALHAALQEYQG